MKNYNLRRRSLFSGPHLLGTLFIAAGLFAIVSPAIFKSGSPVERSFYVGTVAIILGLVIVSTYGGTVIDFNKKRVKDYFSVLGYQFGEWANLPNVTRIVIISVNYKATNTPNGISPTLSGMVTDYKVNLYTESATPIFSFMFSSKARAIKAAKLLSANLDTVYELK